MSELYRDFIDGKADEIVTALGGTITPAPANAELYRDFLDRKFNDVINAIPLSPSSGHHYSTTEQIVGTWIDDSPVYEKTIIQSFPEGTTVYTGTAAHGISNLNIIVQQSTSNFIRQGESIGTNFGAQYYAQIESVDDTYIHYKTNVTREGSERYIIFVIQYTKSYT